MRRDRDDLELDSLDRAVERLDGSARGLWVLGVVFFGAGDTVTTVLGLRANPGVVVEVGPVARLVLGGHGVLGMVGLKVTVFALAGVFWAVTPRPQAIGVPLGLAVFGVLVTVWNSAVILLSIVL